MSSRSPHRPDIRVSQDTGQVTKLSSKASSVNNVALPPSFRSQAWVTNRTVTPHTATSPTSSPQSTTKLSHSGTLSNTAPYNSTSNGSSKNLNFNNTDSVMGMTRGTRPASAERALPDANGKTTEKEYIHNLQQQIQVLELQSKYLRDRDSTSNELDMDVDHNDLASIGKHMALLRKKCIALEQSAKVRTEELENEQEELHKKIAFSEHLLENLRDEKEFMKREVDRSRAEHQGDREKLLDDVMNERRIAEKHARTITALEQNNARLTAEKEKLRTQLSTTESEKTKLEVAREATLKADKANQKREDELMNKISELQSQLDSLKDVKQQISQVEQQSKETIKQAHDDKWTAELKLKQAESALDQVVQAKSKLENDCRMYIEDTTKLRATIDNLQRDLKAEQQKLQARNNEMIAKGEAEGLATQRSNQFFQKWKETTEKVGSQQARVDDLTSELAKARQEIELHKEDKDHLRKESERISAHYLQIEVDSLTTRKENLALQASVAKLQAEVVQHQERLNMLTQENSELQGHYDVLKTRVSIKKEIDKSFTPEELEQMKNTNLQMADTMTKLAKKLSSLTDV